MKPQEPNREEILKKIGDCFQSIMQWSGTHHYDNASNYASQAEALIGLLEVHDCGSFGGFDKGQPPAVNLFDRWDWLYKKYHDPRYEKFGCNTVTYDEIKMFFKSGVNK